MHIEDKTSETVSFGFEKVSRQEKTHRVQKVFERSARHYDLMNDLMSLGVHRLWKDLAITRLNPQPGQHLVDIAGGTGDLARRFLQRAEAVRLRRGGRSASATLVDFNEAMLKAGRKRGEDDSLAWVCGDAEALPLPDHCADAVLISFGIRNVVEKDKALRDMRRLLKPGGRFLCLEFSHPPSHLFEKLYHFYSFGLIPKLGRYVAKDEASYRYLVESIRCFPKAEIFADHMEKAGFKKVSFTRLSGGIAALHQGWAV